MKSCPSFAPSPAARRILVLLALASSLTSGLMAADRTWDGGGGDANWSTLDNWDGVAPVATDVLIFSGSTQLTNTNNFTDLTQFNGLTFASGAGSFVLNTSTGVSSANRITLGGNVTNASSSAQVVNIDLFGNGNRSFDTGSADLTVRRVYASSARTHNKNGSGTLFIGSNTGGGDFSNWNLNAGTMLLQASGTATAIDGVTLAAGTTLRYSNTVTTSPSNNWQGQVNGTVNLNGIGATWDLNGTSGNNNRLQAVIGVAGSVVTNNHATAADFTIRSRSATTNTFAGNIQDGVGTVAVNLQSSNNSGRVNLFSGANTYSGATTITDTTLRAGSTTALSANSAMVMGTATTATLDLNGFNNSVGSLSGGSATGGKVTLGGGTLTSGAKGASTSYAGVISGAGGFTKVGAGTQTFTGANTYIGPTAVDAGTLALGTGGSLDGASAVSIADGATFDTSALAAYSFGTGGMTISVGAATSGLFNAGSAALTLGNGLTINLGTATPAASYNLLDFGSQTGDFSSVALTGSFAGGLTLGATDTWTGTIGGYSFSFSEASGVFSASAIPEPSAFAALAGLGGLLLATGRRRRVV